MPLSTSCPPKLLRKPAHLQADAGMLLSELFIDFNRKRVSR